MQLHNLQPNIKNKKRKRVGRGGKKGTYSGRGVKGQKSRAGRKMQPSMRELIKRYPKLRGYRYLRFNGSAVCLNLDVLEKNFQNSDKITPFILVEKKLVFLADSKIPLVKILGRGEITKKLSISGCQTSKAAKEKIEKAGGRVF
ncbi:50S ribosomal protein L15 [bacterium (Candidatus Gribaldobacteria) CG08_land_8_20_14_0_20_39_15]|uniref:Large ribosomal subunit protein uL15 n=1 Tax=bacterium (Candidatus Gribaldobacteria) CG08_land_8_20_14_0_20_39_15 TaxID=2014273 RepID=A0A2M6XUZ6_9BACT|nr:MAG: 50S ribosomal protein L15 [bacterium (Candidatus Gribaldobacteria) CG08_land_8_20_14_0_20_39_15]